MMRQTPPPISTRKLRWLLALPKLGIVLLLAAVITLLWLLHQNELEEEHASLVLLTEAETGLREVLAGRRVSNDELLKALS